MKKILLLVILLFALRPCFSQDYMDQILNKSCECISNIVDTSNIDNYNTAIGICIIDASMPYQKQIKKDYNIDLNNIADGQTGEKLGQVIGVKLAAFCPKTFQKLSTIISNIKDSKSESTLETIAGTVTKIENDFFVVFSIKDNSGKVSKFNWLDFINSEFELMTSYTSLLGKTVEVSYSKKEYFDPKIEQYRTFNIITQIKVNQ